MRLFAIGDLHLQGGDDKPMNVFGDHWDNHFQRISEDWRARVGEEDMVLIPGDISWAMQLPAARPDLQEIGALPGRKLICKGIRGSNDLFFVMLQSHSQARYFYPFPCCKKDGLNGSL